METHSRLHVQSVRISTVCGVVCLPDSGTNRQHRHPLNLAAVGLARGEHDREETVQFDTKDGLLHLPALPCSAEERSVRGATT